MKRQIKNIVFTMLFSLMFAGAFATTAFASCSVTCAAVCRYTCEFEVYGNCSDSVRDTKVSSCCSGAFASTPGINDVLCTVSGPQN